MFTAPPNSANLVEAQMQYVEVHAVEYARNLNAEGVWLFLAYVGCWGVPNKPAQIFAAILAFAFFVHRFATTLTDRRSFRKMTNDIRERINMTFEEGDTKKARLYELSQVEERIKDATSLRTTFPFVASWMFSGISLALFFGIAITSKGA